MSTVEISSIPTATIEQSSGLFVENDIPIAVEIVDCKVDQVSTGEVPNLRSRLTASNKSTPVALNGDNVVQTNEPYESENAASEKTDLASSDFITQYLTRIFCTAAKAKEKAAKAEKKAAKAEEKAARAAKKAAKAAKMAKNIAAAQKATAKTETNNIVVWECKAGQGWIRYNQSQQTQFENAYQSQQQIFTFRCKYGTSSKEYEYLVDLNQLTQTNKETKVSRVIRRTPVTYAQKQTGPPPPRKAPSTNYTVVWRCKAGNGWVDYGHLQQTQFENAYQNKQQQFDFKCKYGKSSKEYEYSVDLNQLTQTNKETKVSRTIRRSLVIWECKAGNGWVNYGHLQQTQFENAYQNKQQQFDFKSKYGKSSKEYEYSVDLNQLTQTNKETNVSRTIRRSMSKTVTKGGNPTQTSQSTTTTTTTTTTTCSDCFVWECKTSKGWEVFDQAKQIQFENAYQNQQQQFDFKCKYGTSDKEYEYSVDLNQLTQTNKETNVSRSLRRTKVQKSHKRQGSSIPWQITGKTIKSGLVRYEIDSQSVSVLGGNISRELNEFQTASSQFYHHMQSQSQKITMVEVYENATLEVAYENKKNDLAAKGRGVNEVWVFHGTKSQNVQLIMADGFKVGGQGVPVATGTKFGQGVYTATSPTDPSTYTRGDKKLILARALVGTSGPDEKSGADSWTPNKDWRIFRDGAQLLPCYVVHFK
jgi:hypothetical protein